MHKHPSCLGMQLKDPVYQKLCTLTQVPSTVAALAVSLSQRQNDQKLITARKKELEDWCENGRGSY